MIFLLCEVYFKFLFVFLAEQKKIELAEKYKELKSTGKLQKYLNKRRKKTASKDRKQMPQRREATTV